MLAEPSPLVAARLRVVRVAIALGWVSVAVVVAATLLGDGNPAMASEPAVWALAAAAAMGNLLLGRLPWPRLVGRPIGERLLGTWALCLVGLVAGLTVAGGGWRSDFYLLAFLVVPFVALTEPRRQQVGLYALLLVTYLLAVLPDAPAGVVAARLGVLAGASVLAAVVAETLEALGLARARAESEARVERLLADEAHHRIKNNLQLVGDLLELEAGKADGSLGTVVEETLSRIGSVAAVHSALARRGEGRVTLRPVIERVVALLAGRLGSGRSVQVEADDTELAGDRATWTALVVNELVTNALRHGRGAVTVRIGRTSGGLRLAVADEGPGPQGAAGGLGTALVQRLVEEGMYGHVERACSASGFEVAVNLPFEEST